MKRLYLSIFVILLLVYTAMAQKLDFAHLNVENGLSQKSALCIAQDSRGFLWFGTANGLNRYDSRNFKVYNISPSGHGLKSEYIISLFSDLEGKLWVGTSNGLYKYRPQTDDFDRIKLSFGADHKRIQIINCITQDHQKNIWVGTTTGLYLLNGDTGESISFFAANANGLPGNNVHTVAVDDTGNIWVGTEKGLTMMSMAGNTFSFKNFKHSNQPGSIADDNIASIVTDENHKLWIGLHEKGLESYDNVTGQFKHYPNTSNNGSDNIRQVITDGNGKLWIGTQDGLSQFNTKTGSFFTYKRNADDAKSLNQNSIYSLFIDKHKTLWVGTYFGGINIGTASIFNKYQSNNTHTAISNDVVSAIVEDHSSNLWLGTEGGGLNYIDHLTKKITVYQHQKNNVQSISSNLIKTVYQDTDANVWVGTHGGGLNVLAAGKNTFTKYLYDPADAETAGSEIRSIVEDTNGLLWIGTNTGLKVFKRNNTFLTLLSSAAAMIGQLKDQPINNLFIDSQGRLWAGSWGVFVLHNGRMIPLPLVGDKNMLNKVRINCITQGSNGNIWIGTDTHGLYKYEPDTKRIYNYTENEGLANNNVYGIIPDEHSNLWISTGNGLSNLNTKSNIFHNYTTRDGLAGNDFNKNSYTRLRNGEILFGGFNGYTGFFPKDINENEGKPIAYLTGLKLFNQPVQVGDESKILSTDISLSKTITFQYSQNVFTIDFVILNYIRSEKNKYAYQIENIDQNWNYTNTPSATYNNLPPGKYHFLVKGRNNDGIWSEPVSLIIKIEPPWWRTWWAYLLYALAIAAVIFIVVRYLFLQALLKKDHELTELKLNFFNNISHEIRTYLSLISAPVEKLLMRRTEQDNDTHQLETIKKNSDELLQLVNELMDFRKAETGNLSLHVSNYNVIPFVQSVVQSFQDVALSKNIKTTVAPTSGEIELYFDKEQMKKVLFNLISNAYKFTPNGGEVGVSIEDSSTEVNIKVTDNGKGISPENIAKLFHNYFQEHDYGHQNTGYGVGLALSKSIIELHKGDLSVESNIAENNTKTVFTITLKKGDAHFKKDQLSIIQQYANSGEAGQTPIPVPLTLITNSAKPGLGAKYTVLIVEDNTDVRKFIADSLKTLYNVYEAANGVEGFEIATQQIPDLIISDVMMPEMDGFTFCHKIKTDERTDHIPVILLTAKAEAANQISGLKMGADVYLTKPFSIQILELQVQNLISAAEKLRKLYNRQITAGANTSNHTPAQNDPVLAETILAKDHTTENEFINKIVTFAEANLADPDFDVEMIARHIGMSQSVLYKKIKALTELTVNDLVKEVRFKKAAELLSQNDYTVYEVAYMVGYNDVKYFSREFKKQFGVTPSSYKESSL